MPWTAAPQSSLPFTLSQSLLKPMSIESVMPSNVLILCHLLLLPSINNKGIMDVYFPDGSAIKNLPASVGDPGLIPRSGRSPGKGNDNPFRCSCLRNPMGERSLAGYSPWDLKRTRYDLVTKQQQPYVCVHTEKLNYTNNNGTIIIQSRMRSY